MRLQNMTRYLGSRGFLYALAILTYAFVIGPAPGADLPISGGSNQVAVKNPVTLTVTAFDAKGRPLPDLTCADLELTDDGKPAHIARCDTPSSQPATTMIVWDLLNTVRGHRGYQAELLIHTLESLKAGRAVSLYLLTNRGDVYPVHALDRDSPGTPWTQQIRSLLDHALQEVTAFRPMDNQNEGIRAGTTFLRLSELKEQLSGVNSAKSIVWISSGVPNLMLCPYGCRDVLFPAETDKYVAGKCSSNCPLLGNGDCIDYAPFLRRFAQDMGRSNIGLYAVEETPIGGLARANHGSAKDTLRQLADLSGARLFDRGDIERAVTSAIDDASARFQLTLESRADGKYHKLRIASTRKGVRIQAPAGYFADQR
jgi:VWFA-related protein